MTLMHIVDAALACLVAGILIRVVTIYLQTTGTPWERLLAAAKNSATILKEYVVIIGARLRSILSKP